MNRLLTPAIRFEPAAFGDGRSPAEPETCAPLFACSAVLCGPNLGVESAMV